MAHKLEGHWRSAIIVFGAGLPTLTNDDDIYLNSIDPHTGKILDGFHKIGSDALQIEGLVIPHGSGYSIMMEHQEHGSTTRVRRYQGSLAFDSPIADRLVIFARKFTRLGSRPGFERAEMERAAVPIEPPQDDGTVIIVRP